MTRITTHFRLPSKVSDRSVIESLRTGFEVRPTEVVKARRTFLDTPDWRVLRGGWTLHHGTDSPSLGSLVLCDAGDDRPIGTHASEDPIHWAGDLPDVAPWADVASTVGERRLLRRLQVETTIRRFALLDDESKTTVRVSIERHSALEEEGALRHVRFMTVAPVRGYEREARRICSLLSKAGYRPQARGLLGHLSGLGGAGLTTKLRPDGVETERRAAVGLTLQRILATLRNEMVSNEAGVRSQVDIEYLHDYRVAGRRARSVLNQVGGIFPGDSARRLSDDLRWLGTFTGPPRDIDVQLSEADHAADDFEGLRRLLEQKRADAQIDLVAALDSARYKALIEGWTDLENAALAASKSGPGAQPAGAAADRYLDRAHRRVLRIGKFIDDSSPAEALHDLRKKTKAFRYMIEMFAPLYPEQDLKIAVRELKALQDNLGEFQDTQVQAASLRALAEEMVHVHSGSASELMAMGRIADSLEARQRRARAEFEARFDRFASPQVTRRYQRMLRTSRGTL